MSSETYEQVLALTCELIEQRSVTPEDGACQQILAERLTNLGFSCEQIDHGGVKNLWATRSFGDAVSSDSQAHPHLMFAGHTDVVPPGALEAWSSDPFSAQQRAGKLYGRGAADMKASLAAMVVACESATLDDLAGTLSFLITSDEEGPAIHGTRHVVDILAARGVLPDFCIVGEPSSTKTVGDVVRVGRRGSLNGNLKIKGVQGHVAYPDDADNPVHKALIPLAELCSTRWDGGDDYYPPTSFQISNVNAGTGATNVIPGNMEVVCNFRFNTQHTPDSLQLQVMEALSSLETEAVWTLSGLPFITEPGILTDCVSQAIEAVSGVQAELSPSGGTSDGRFIAPWSPHHQVAVVELGPTNSTIHKVDECVGLEELEPLCQIYTHIINGILAK